MKRSAIEVAKRMMSRREFGAAIRMLQGYEENYQNSFEYYCTLGIACLYVGDAGAAGYNFELARKIKVNDSNLLLGQAAIFLRRGDTERAVQYYLDILDFDPQNKTAKIALEFIRVNGNYETICQWLDAGKLEKFYPPLGVNTKVVAIFSFAITFGIICGVLLVNLLTGIKLNKVIRADLSELALSTEEKNSPQQKDISENLVRYILSDKQIKTAYNKASEYFHAYDDNAALVEINRILNSNASSSIRKKARTLMEYLQEPTFDSIKSHYSVNDVKQDPFLYLDCFVDWSGRIANVEKFENSENVFIAEKFTLLVGYEDQKNVQGTVVVELDFIPTPELDGSKPVRVLGKICLDGDRIFIKGKSVYQNIQ